MTIVSIEKLDAGYSSVQVLFGLSMAVESGSCLGILGPNGAGKSTLVRTISGFLRPRGGSIVFDGKPIGACSPHEIVRRGISQVFQGRQVLGPMSVHDNLLLGAHLTFASHGRDAVHQTLAEVYDLFPILQERAGMAAASLSGGEQQMLAIGRALMSRPRVLLLDEPSMGLAPMVVQQILDVLRRIKLTGMTMILIEQNPDFAFGLADRCCVMESGHIVLEGPTDILRNHEQMASLYLGSA
jgi:branched-chain amino acid transport system ATP-binding protein